MVCGWVIGLVSVLFCMVVCGVVWCCVCVLYVLCCGLFEIGLIVGFVL